jgi:predicted RNA-binding protein with PUA-like domain
MKSEPDCYSIDDLKRDKITHWDGVRNYQARNMMRDIMKIGDMVFFYHSNAKPPGIVGVAEVCKESYPDFTAFDPESDHPCQKSTPDSPIWFMVDIRFKLKFKDIVPLETLKKFSEIDGMQLLRKGNRLSVMPVNKDHWEFILQLEKSC